MQPPSANSQPSEGENDRSQAIPTGILETLFGLEPGVGVAVVSLTGLIEYVNERTAAVFTRGSPEDCIGYHLHEIFDQAWADERLRVFQHVKGTGRPVIVRSIRHGQRIQSTVREIHAELSDDASDCPRFLVVTVEGEHDPAQPDQYDIVEAETVSFGELDPLTAREIEVLAMIGHGMTAAQIAKALHRSPRTIERHTDSIRAKLRETSRVQLAAFARRAGLRVEDSLLTRVTR